MNKICLFVVFLVLSAQAVAEDVRYVSDNLIITMRSGASGTHKIVRTLQSGTKLVMLETSEDSRYTRIRTDDGTEGWVLSQYLSEDPAAKDLLTAAEQKLDAYKASQSKLNERIKSLNKQLNEIREENTKLQSENKSVKTEIASISKAAARPIAIERENKDLRNTLGKIQKDLQIMRAENHVLKDRSNKEWFVAGGGVLLIGIILGIIVPRIRWRKKDSWGSL